MLVKFIWSYLLAQFTVDYISHPVMFVRILLLCHFVTFSYHLVNGFIPLPLSLSLYLSPSPPLSLPPLSPSPSLFVILKCQVLILLLFYLLRVFHIFVSGSFSLSLGDRSPGHSSIFWPISTMLLSTTS